MRIEKAGVRFVIRKFPSDDGSCNLGLSGYPRCHFFCEDAMRLFSLGYSQDCSYSIIADSAFSLAIR